LDVFLKILANDGMFAMISIAIVYFYMRFMLSSWFLANVGFLEIVLSIPTAWFFAEWLFQVDYFSSLNPLCLFIVAAIGADDIFVFMDAYKQR
jgi:protein dispatched 1